MSALMEQHERWSEARTSLGMPWVPVARVRRPVLRIVETPPPPSPPPTVAEAVHAEVVWGVRHWRRIVEEVAAKHGVTFKDIVGPSRIRKFVLARHEAFWRLRNEIKVLGKPMSYPAIAIRFNRSDHTVPIHGVKMHEQRMREAAGG